MKSTSIVVLLMITEEEISHQNNNIFDLSHPSGEGGSRDTHGTSRQGWEGTTANLLTTKMFTNDDGRLLPITNNDTFLQ